MITAIKKDSSDKYQVERDPLTAKIIKACYEIHNELGPGFVERVYTNAIRIALEKFNLKYVTEKEFVVKYDNKNVGKFRIDFFVEDKVIVEIKAVEGKMPKLFESQVISYLKASGIKVGLLVNFGNRKCEVRRLMV